MSVKKSFKLYSSHLTVAINETVLCANKFGEEAER